MRASKFSTLLNFKLRLFYSSIGTRDAYPLSVFTSNFKFEFLLFSLVYFTYTLVLLYLYLCLILLNFTLHYPYLTFAFFADQSLTNLPYHNQQSTSYTLIHFRQTKPPLKPLSHSHSHLQTPFQLSATSTNTMLPPSPHPTNHPYNTSTFSRDPHAINILPEFGLFFF